MSSKIRRIDFSPTEWLEGTTELDNATRGLYVTACALMWARSGPIDLELLRDACRDHGNAFNRQLSTLRRLGKLMGNDEEITNKRAINELENAKKRSGNARENGSKRWKNKGLEKPSALQGGNARARNHQPSTIREANASLSDTNVSGAAAPSDDPIKAMWVRGVRLLTGAGSPEKSARSLLGKWRREYGEIAVMAAVLRCEAEAASDPVAFVTATLTAHGNLQRLDGSGFGSPGFA